MESICDIYSTRLLHMWQVLGQRLCVCVALGFCSFTSCVFYVIILIFSFEKTLTQRLSFCGCHFCSGIKNISKDMLSLRTLTRLRLTPVLRLSLESRCTQTWLCSVFPNFCLTRHMNANEIMTAAICPTQTNVSV